MAAPEGYKTLGKIGISYKGDYNPNTVYERLDAVYHNGSTYLAIKDAPDGAPRNDKINWIYLAKGYDGETVDVADSEIAFTDSETRENISTGEKVSTVFGKIKKFFADLAAPAFAQMITTKEDLLATKVTGYVPDAKAVADTYTELNRKLTASDNTPFRFGVTASGEYGYVVTDSAGADTVIPFKKYGTPTILYSYGVSNSGAGSVSTTKTMPRDGLCIVFAHTCGSNYFLNPTVKLNNVAQKILTSYKADDNTKGGNAACFEVKKGDSVYALAPKDSGSSGQAGIIMLII